MLDTGQHLQIHGNVEFDRLTLKAYDYLNFFPFYVKYALSRNVDMPGVEVLDDAGVPLLVDSFGFTNRYQGFQLFQRGVRWRTLQYGLQNRFTSRTVRDLIDEWQTGFEMSTAVTEQLERELIGKLADPSIRYLDYFSGEFDHIAHLTNDPVVQDRTMEHIDALVGRVWTAIQQTSLRDDTVLVLVSDHGINSVADTYSQGYSLLDLFRSAKGGGHHVITNRYPLSEYKIRGLDPFVSKVTTASDESFYLQGKTEQYPTALLDLDGNERASISLRDNRLNKLHLLLREIQRAGQDPALRKGAVAEVLRIIDGNRARWTAELKELTTCVDWLKTQVTGFDAKSALKKQQPKWTPSERTRGLDQQYRREIAARSRLREYLAGYTEYLRILTNLLSLDQEQVAAGKYEIPNLIAERAMGDRNSVRDLQNYVVGLSPGGLKLDSSGGIDPASFRTIDYLSLLASLRVRNNVQKGVGATPVDFIAVRLAPDKIWLYSDDAHQALVLTRGSEIRYLPVHSLTEGDDGEINYGTADWAAGFPLKIFEDPSLAVSGDRIAWLNSWHTEAEWFAAVHKTNYSNGIIGITEAVPNAAVDGESFNRFARAAVTPDFIVFANDHWNFNVRGFNPGGNHGAFFRISTHSSLMFAGAGIGQGVEITAPYDSLSFVPTILSILNERPKSPLPGQPIEGVVPLHSATSQAGISSNP
jgi:hypothetical protein